MSPRVPQESPATHTSARSSRVKVDEQTGYEVDLVNLPRFQADPEIERAVRGAGELMRMVAGPEHTDAFDRHASVLGLDPTPTPTPGAPSAVSTITALLRFTTAEAADRLQRVVEQLGRVDGRWVVADGRVLTRLVLPGGEAAVRHVLLVAADVEVLEPPELRDQVRETLRESHARHERPSWTREHELVKRPPRSGEGGSEAA